MNGFVGLAVVRKFFTTLHSYPNTTGDWDYNCLWSLLISPSTQSPCVLVLATGFSQSLTNDANVTAFLNFCKNFLRLGFLLRPGGCSYIEGVGVWLGEILKRGTFLPNFKTRDRMSSTVCRRFLGFLFGHLGGRGWVGFRLWAFLKSLTMLAIYCSRQN